MPHAPVRPSSLWWQDAAPDGAPPLRGRTTAEVVVVGAGIVGVTLAADLAVEGVDVVLLEAGRVGCGATGHTTAKATALQSPRYARLAAEHGEDAAALYAQLSLDAVERIRTDAERLGSDNAGAATALTWTHCVDEVETIEQEHRAAQRAGLPVRLVHTHDRLELAAGVALDDQLQFEPVVHLRGLLARGLAAGLRLYEASPVSGVSLTGERRTVTTAQGSVRAHRVVVATGLPVLDRGGWFARMEPEVSYVVALRGGHAPAEMGLRIGDSVRSSRAATGPDGEPLVLVAGAGHAVGKGGDTRQHPAALRAWGHATFEATDEAASWSAQDWHPADGLPLAGALVPGDDRVLAAAGFAKWGLTSGTAAAGTLRRRLLGVPATGVDRLLSPARRPGARGAGRLASLNAGVGWSMTAGWLRAVRQLGDAPAEGEGRVGRDGHRPVATSTVDGRTRRCSAVCPHLGGIVGWDTAGQTWSCPLHGSRFDHDGRVVSGPATRPLGAAD